MTMRIYLLVVATLLSITSFAQPDFTLTVHVPENTPEAASLLIDRSFLGSNQEKTDGNFQYGKVTMNARVGQSRMAELQFDGLSFSLYVEPAGELFMTVDQASGVPSIQLAGNLAAANALVQRFYRKFDADFNDSLQHAKMLSATVDEYEMEIYKNRKNQLAFLNADSAFSTGTEYFHKYMQLEVDYRYWTLLLSYPIIRANSDRTIMSVTPLPDVMTEQLFTVRADNEPALANQSYREFIKYYVTYQTSKLNGFKKFTDYSISAERKSAVARERFKDPVYQFWVARFLRDEWLNLSPFIGKKLKNELSVLDKQQVYMPVINKVCDDRTVGASIPTALQNNANADKTGEPELKDPSGKTVKMADFKGKVVYIDFWASWCGPCRMMMPFSKQLHESLTDKQRKEIVFLYISIDGNDEAWRKAMQDIGMEGVNVISPGNWSSPACAYYRINSIPRYMIMNKKGDIVEMDATRPNDPELMNKLLKLAAE